MADYSQDAADALADIRAAGGQFPITRAQGTFSPADGTVAAGAPEAGTIDAVVLKIDSAFRQLFNEELRQEIIRGNVKKLLVAAASAPFRPQTNDTVELAPGEVWRVVGMTPIDFDNTQPIIYTLAISKI